jgi:CBS domain containing-hemolysin-like protein
MTPGLLSLLLFAGCAGLSFLFSGLEAGVFALNRLRVRQLARAGNKGARTLQRFLDHPENFLWTLLIGNTLANFVLLGLGFAWLYGWLGGHLVWFVAVALVSVFAFYTFLDLLPKMLFQQYPTRPCLALARPFHIIHFGLSPLVWLVERGSVLLLGLTGGRAFRGELFGNREELRLVMQEGAQAFSSEERAMISRVLELPSRTVGQVATPLAKTATIHTDTPVADILALVRERNLTRLPVWGMRDRQKRIVGVLNVDHLLFQPALDPARRAEDFMKPAVFLGERMRLDEAMRRLQRSGQRLAVVLANDGHEMGILSLEDILAGLFGEVRL